MNTNKLSLWLATRREQSTMEVTSGSLGGIEPWDYRRNENGDIEYSRADGKFFRLAGFKVTTKVREVFGWTQPMLEELTGPGVIILVTDGDNFLVTAREEPGNNPEKNHILLGPTLQASESNLTGVHGGKLPPRAELYTNPDLDWFVIPGDGGRYFNKTNRLGILYVTSNEFPKSGELLENEFWAARKELFGALRNGDINPHLAECLAAVLVLECNGLGREY